MSVGVVAACYGAWLVWRAITNDIWRDGFGQPMIPRWLYFLTGLICLFGGVVVVVCIMNSYRQANL